MSSGETTFMNSNLTKLVSVTSAPFNASATSILAQNAGRIAVAWLVCEVLSIAMTVILTYIIISLSVFQLRYGTRRSRLRGERNICGRKCSNSEILFGLTMTAAVFAFVRCFSDIDLIWGRYSELNCRYMKKPKIVLAFISLLFGILTYWMRQRIFYSNKQLKHIVNKFTRFVSVWILGALGIVFFAGLLYFMIQDAGYRPLPPYGCSQSSNIVPFALVGLTIFLSQITLVFLLVYPIFKKKRLSNSIKGRSSSVRSRSSSSSSGQRKLMTVVRKSSITAMVAVSSNLIGLILEAVIVTYVDNIGMAIVDINLTILVLCTVISNADAKKRLMTYCAGKPTPEKTSTSNIPSSTSQSRTCQNSPMRITQNGENCKASQDKSEKSNDV